MRLFCSTPSLSTMPCSVMPLTLAAAPVPAMPAVAVDEVGVADQGYADLGAGVNEVIGSLFLNGIMQANGTYGSSLSSAMFKLDDYFAGSGILQIGVTPPIFAGDYNDDGFVDAADYVLGRINVGQPAGTLPNDDTGMTIGNDQYVRWRSNFGKQETGSGGGLNGLGQVQGAVPEPSSIALLMLGLGAPAGLRRRR